MRRWALILGLVVCLAGCEGDNAMVNNGPTSTPQIAGPRTLPAPPVPPEQIPRPADEIPPPDLPPRNEIPPPPAEIPPPPAIDPGEETRLIQIDKLEILERESFPPLISAHVIGVVGDGCSNLNAITQNRLDNLIEITISASRPRNIVCDASAQIFDRIIDLEGEFPAGEYIISVNGLEEIFTP